MKYNGNHFYFYLGKDGIIITLNFDFKNKNHDIQLSLTHSSIHEEEF